MSTKNKNKKKLKKKKCPSLIFPVELSKWIIKNLHSKKTKCCFYTPRIAPLRLHIFPLLHSSYTIDSPVRSTSLFDVYPGYFRWLSHNSINIIKKHKTKLFSSDFLLFSRLKISFLVAISLWNFFFIMAKKYIKATFFFFFTSTQLLVRVCCLNSSSFKNVSWQIGQVHDGFVCSAVIIFCFFL